MELNNELSHYISKKKASERNMELLEEVMDKFLIILTPFTPHMAEELWSMKGNRGLVVEQRWPGYDEEAMAVDEVPIVVQINGKVRDKFKAPKGQTKEETEKMALAREKIAERLEGKSVRKVIVVPGKLVNIVAG